MSSYNLNYAIDIAIEEFGLGPPDSSAISNLKSQISNPMTPSAELIALAEYMTGEFDNREQALDSPAWYVHLRLWQRPLPVALFDEPSIALFAEQANILELDKPYRPRIVQLRHSQTAPGLLEAQYYQKIGRSVAEG
ncbi:MAG: CpcT/CpeT family chromophore lyase [Microcoleus sp.]